MYKRILLFNLLLLILIVSMSVTEMYIDGGDDAIEMNYENDELTHKVKSEMLSDMRNDLNYLERIRENLDLKERIVSDDSEMNDEIEQTIVQLDATEKNLAQLYFEVDSMPFKSFSNKSNLLTAKHERLKSKIENIIRSSELGMSITRK